MLKQGSRQAQTHDPEQAQKKPTPAHGVDRFTKQAAGEQGDEQRLGINQDRTQARPGLAEALGQEALEQAAIHEGKGHQPGPIGGGNPQGTLQHHRSQHHQRPRRQQPKKRQQQGVSPL